MKLIANTPEYFNIIAEGIIKALGCQPTSTNVDEMAWYLAFFYKAEIQPVLTKI